MGHKSISSRGLHEGVLHWMWLHGTGAVFDAESDAVTMLKKQTA